MHKILAFNLLLLLSAGAVHAMSGGPVFCLTEKMTGMTVEATQAAMKLNSGSGSESFMSQRLMLTARFGLLPSVDMSAQLGTSNLAFRELPSGYSDFSAGWTFAWGGSVRAGLPQQANPFQIVGALNYFGFQPSGTTGNGTKSISSSYVWHEITPSLTAGYAVGPLVPYVGMTKPFLFGNKTIDVAFNGQNFPAAGGKTSYKDGDQALRGVLGLEWRWPDGYSLNAEGAASSDGLWTLSVGVSQILK